MAGHVAAAGQLTGSDLDDAEALDYPDAGDVDQVSDIDDQDDDLAVESSDEEDEESARSAWTSPLRLAAVVGSVAFVALAALMGWLGFDEYQTQQAQAQHQLFVQAARQGAVNLTTIDWQHADTDVQRVVDSATGAFHDDFSARSQPFVDVVKQAQSTSVGTVSEAALESISGDNADVLVTVSVKTTMPNQPEGEPRSWRMRISLHEVSDGEPKITNVVFVP